MIKKLLGNHFQLLTQKSKITYGLKFYLFTLASKVRKQQAIYFFSLGSPKHSVYSSKKNLHRPIFQESHLSLKVIKSQVDNTIHKEDFLTI